ncbi:hypothetical protein GCM10009037_07170 [Halarchaeum grantii]|uniref:Uncharacterized protein n=1 Tax=Halarchaeum grantii TaxID=1193105 RepID=A0A830F004_9EURY|nr:hypothetical protein [Halarchaeum grantii]GGL26106.1 hypothetical protein GCM10009037_07170 [Halarchaeum grantii]
MSVLGSVADGVGRAVVFVIAFAVAAVGWAALTGVVGGMLDAVGIVIPASTYLAATPIVSGLAASYVVMRGER